jgi:MBG domain (YGX type)
MLTVNADNKTATEGDGLPTFAASYSGFVNGDN